jgi:hypothetical protein
MGAIANSLLTPLTIEHPDRALMNSILQQIQRHAAALPLSAQAELLNYAAYLAQKAREKTPVVSAQTRRDRLSAALAQAVVLNPFSEIVDPVAWQREQCQDLSLPRGNDAN